MPHFLLSKKFLFFVTVWMALPSFSFSQHTTESDCTPKNNDFIFSSSLHVGGLFLPPRMQDVIKDGASGVELNFIIPTHGSKCWQRNYRYPEMGLTFLEMDFGNLAELGQGYCLYPFINFNLTHGKYFSLKFKIANSLGYVTKIYDPVENPRNLAIGSHFNGFVNLRLNAQVRLSKHMRLELGFGLTHFSNGAMDLPNAGMNVLSYNLGLGYHFNTKNVQLLPDTFSKPDQHLHFVTYASTGMCSISRLNQAKYVSGVFSVNIERNKGSRTKWNGGIELAYNTARLTLTKMDSSIHNYKNLQNLQVGIKAGYAFVAGRLILPVEMGYYVYDKPRDGYFFHRVGVRCRASEHFIVGITLKTEWANASFFEATMGYTFPLKKQYKN